jgi:hypothetical protein
LTSLVGVRREREEGGRREEGEGGGSANSSRFEGEREEREGEEGRGLPE